ncbi:sugar-phosphatase [bacterium LRH843]|nr:sugar-phosphatase [bacterium LRH843]
MAIKLIAIDIDGTLINSKHEITPYTKEVIHRVRKNGVRVVLCTGRPFLGAERYAKELGLDLEEEFLITYNGALLQNTFTKETIHHIGLSGKDYKGIANLAMEIETHFHALDFGAIYTSNRDMSRYTGHDSYFTTMPIQYRTVEEINDKDEFTKIMLIDEPDILDTAIAKIPAEFYEEYTIFKSEAFYCEILNKNASKGQAVQKLATLLNISQHEVMAIGDHPNDYDMVQYAGIGVAMGNAVEEVKNIADYITYTNNEDGVAKAIELFVLEEIKL